MIKTVIIDDEPLAAGIVKEYLGAFSEFEVLGMFHDGFQGLKAIQELTPDLIFLDVQMPKITGFEMLELVENPPSVIFTTAFDEYAVKAFDAKAIDYLLKPFSAERFNQAIDRYLKELKSSVVEVTEFESLAEKTNRIVVRVKNEIKVISTPEIEFFEAQDDYVAIHVSGNKYLKKITMKSLENSLDQSKFVRCHRSYLVNMDHITKIEPYEKDGHLIRLKSGAQIPVSKTGYSRLRQVLGL